MKLKKEIYEGTDLVRETAVRAEQKKLDIKYEQSLSQAYRYAMVVGVAIASCFLGPPCMNWPPLRDAIKKSGGFNYLCDNPRNIKDIECTNKSAKLANIGSTSNAVYYACVIFCGLFYDVFGAKVAGCSGIIVTCLGWILLGLSGPSFNGHEVAVYMFTGALDCTYLGLISVSNLFPNYSSTIVAIFGSARSVSFAIPKLMGILFDAGVPLRIIAFTYAGILLILFALIAYFIPKKPFPKQSFGSELDETLAIEMETEEATSLKKEKWSLKLIKRVLRKQAIDIWPYFCTSSYWIFVIILTIALTRGGYLIATSEIHYKDTESFYSTMSPLSFIPCPFLGMMVDKFSAAMTCGLLALFGATSLSLAIPLNIETQYISIMFNWIYISFLSSQCYCYISYIYPQKVIGKLAGLAFLVAGLSSLSVNSLTAYANKSYKNLVTLDCAGLIAVIASLYLYIFNEKPSRNRIEKSTQKMTDHV